MIKNGFLSKKFEFELKILAKYLFFVKNMPKKNVKSVIIAFCEKNETGFNINIHYGLINKVITYLSSKKCRLVKIESVYISDEFVNYFKTLKFSKEIKKLLFTTAVLGKVNEQLGFSERYASSYVEYKDVKDMANVKIDGDIYLLFKDLSDQGYVNMTHKGVLVLNFVDSIPKGEDIYKIDDFTNLGNWFDLYNGEENIYRCEKCNKVFKKRFSRGSHQKLCNDCGGVDKKGNRIKIKNIKLSFCVECGKELFLESKNKKNMCPLCYDIYRKKYFKDLYLSKKISQE